MIINVKVIPKAKFNRIDKITDAEYKIYTTEAPDKGKANEKVIKMFAKELGIAKSRFKVTKGEMARNKIIQVDN